MRWTRWMTAGKSCFPDDTNSISRPRKLIGPLQDAWVALVSMLPWLRTLAYSTSWLGLDHVRSKSEGILRRTSRRRGPSHAWLSCDIQDISIANRRLLLCRRCLQRRSGTCTTKHHHRQGGHTTIAQRSQPRASSDVLRHTPSTRTRVVD